MEKINLLHKDDSINDEKLETHWARSTKETENSGLTTTRSSCFRLAAVCLGLLCFLLLAAIAVLWIRFTAERDQLQNSNRKLAVERDQLQISYSSLTVERDQLQTSFINLVEKDQLKISNKNLLGDQEQLEEKNNYNYNKLSEEKDLPKNSNDKLPSKKDKIQDIIKQTNKQSYKTSYNNIQANYWNLTIMKEQLKLNNSHPNRKRHHLQKRCIDQDDEIEQLLLINNKLAAQNKQISITNDKLQKEKDQLHTSYNSLQRNYSSVVTEKDKLKITNDKLVTEKDQLKITNDKLAKEKDQIQENLKEVTKQKDQIQQEKDRLQELNNLGKEHKTREELLKYFCQFTFDPNTAFWNFHLSKRDRVVTYKLRAQSYPDHPDRFNHWRQVLCRESISGRCYWEVEWMREKRFNIAVTYKNICRKGNNVECQLGSNSVSWNLLCISSQCSFWHKNKGIDIPIVPSSKIGVYVDHKAGILSFYSVSDTMKLLHTVKTTFTQPLYPAVELSLKTTAKLSTP